MSRLNFRFLDSSVHRLVDLTEGTIPAKDFEEIVFQLETEASKFYFNQTSEANFLRIANALYDRSYFFRALPNFPHHAEIVIAIAASSNYLTDIIVQHPEYLYQLFDNYFLTTQIEYDDLATELKNGIRHYTSLNARLNHLRQFKQRFILKIGTNDILHFDELIDSTKQLSILARVINERLFEICYDEVLLRNNLKRPKNKFCLCSLGKLGGEELNYSSDVDLILFYDSNFQFAHNKKDYHEILAETVQLFSKSSTDITSNGYIYRVDFRLRPDGKYSPLCKTLDDYIKYYEARGEDWERQMLIKLGFIGGDKALFNKFTSFVIPYVYKNNYSASIKDKIRMMKQNIERMHLQKDDVKTFIGGIRDIEFTVQALQLLNGGKYSNLRTGNSLIALKNLHSHKLISKPEYKSLTESYIFYRRIEHFLQLMNDQQTHVIPDDPHMIEKLAVYLQLNSADEFRSVLDKYRKNVREIYDKFLKNDSRISMENEISFTDKSKAAKNFQFLRSGQGIIERKEFDSRTIELFNSIEPVLSNFLKNSQTPDLVLDNFVRVIRGSNLVSIWYSEFTNKKFFESFLFLCQNCQKCIDLLAISNNLADYFLSRKAFVKQLQLEYDELTIDHLLFALSVQYSLGLIDEEKVSALLSDYVLYSISSILGKEELSYKYFVAGLGSYGSSNMNFSSDIDLIVVADDIMIDENIQSRFQEFLFKIQNKLKPLEVDFRLRPEGKKSQLVWDLENYTNYLNKRARIWEYQSLSKLKFVCGDSALYNKFRKIVITNLSGFSKEMLGTEIKSMHNSFIKQNSSAISSLNIKKQKGGLTTLDFLIQFLLLSNPSLLSKMKSTTYKNIVNTLKQIISNEDLESLVNNRKQLRKMEFTAQCLFNSSGGSIPLDEKKKLQLALYLGYTKPDDFDAHIKSILKSNITLFEKYLGV